LNLHQFYRDGIQLLGHLRGYQGGRLLFALDLKDSLSNSDQQSINMVKMVDTYIEKSGMDAQPSEQPEMLKDAYTAADLLSLNIRQVGISTIIWAAGYSFDFRWVKFPVFDSSGFPITRGGVTQVPGLYFAGLPWLDTQKTGLLLGVGEGTSRLAEKIEAAAEL
jgi:putative flavoprotein involved in K+ transport